MNGIAAKQYSKNSNLYKQLACYMLPNRSRDSPSFAYASSSSRCRSRRSCVSLAQPPILTHLVW